MAMPHGRGQVQHARMGGTRDGRITAYQLDVVQDAGAFPLMGAILHDDDDADGDRACYHIANVGFTASLGGHQHVVDHGLPRCRAAGGGGRHRAHDRPVRRRDRHGSCRGAATQPGAPVPRAVHDRHRHRLRRRRLPGGARAGPRRRRLRRAAGRAGAPAGRRRPGRSSASASPSTSRSRPAVRAPSSVRSSCTTDGRLTVRTASTPFGQGHDTTWAMIVADRTGVPIDAHRGRSTATPTRCARVASRSGRARCRWAARRSPTATDAARSSRHASGPPTCSRRPSTTSCSTSTPGAFHVAGTPARDARLGRPRRQRRRTRWPADIGLRANDADVPVRRPRRGRRGRHRDRRRPVDPPRGRRRRRHAASTRCSPRARCTAESPRAWRRRCSRHIRYDDDGQPKTTNFADYLVDLGGRAAVVRGRAHGDPDVGQPARAPRASASPARSAPSPPCTTR